VSRMTLREALGDTLSGLGTRDSGFGIRDSGLGGRPKLAHHADRRVASAFRRKNLKTDS
jgi:hypothetical protein